MSRSDPDRARQERERGRVCNALGLDLGLGRGLGTGRPRWNGRFIYYVFSTDFPFLLSFTFFSSPFGLDFGSISDMMICEVYT